MMTGFNRQTQIANIGTPQTVWTIPSIHGDIDRLIHIHNHILKNFRIGDRLVYLGNYIGYGPSSAECITEILTFRRMLLSRAGMKCSDITYLRGSQEEMWQKILQLPFAADPTNIFLWMLSNGMRPILHSYGLCEHDGIEACRAGVMGLTKWVNKIRAAIRKHPGHETFGTHLVQASHTDTQSEHPILFVNAGLDASKPLEQQGDNFWWMGTAFEKMENPYLPFQKVVRGYDPLHRGLHLNCTKATIDDGCGFGGKLISAAFSSNGDVLDIIEA
jgi:serine/threonine protein phosphatase 1